MLVQQPMYRAKPRRVRVDNPPHHMKELRYVSTRPVLVDIPSFFQHLPHQILVILHGDFLDHPSRMPLVRHLDQDLIPQSDESRYVEVTVNLGEFGEWTIDNVLSFEVSTISVEPVRHKHWDIIHPVIARSGAEKNPTVVSGENQEFGNPLTRTNKSLFIKDEEGSTDMLISTDVVPAIDGEYATNSSLTRSANPGLRKLSFPVQRISLLGRGNDVDIFR